MLHRDLWTILCECADFSEYESKVYVSLIMNGPSTARKISMMCGVPRTKIYSVFKKLIDRGLVVETPTKPQVFLPLSPAESLRNIVESYKARVNELKEALALLERKYNLHKNSNFLKADFWILKGRRNILTKVEEMLQKAKSKVLILTTENGSIQFFKMFNKKIDCLVEKGVKIIFHVKVGNKNLHMIKELKYLCDVSELRSVPPILFLNVDEEATLLSFRDPDDYSSDSSRDLGIFLQNRNITDLFSKILTFHRRKTENLISQII